MSDCEHGFQIRAEFGNWSSYVSIIASRFVSDLAIGPHMYIVASRFVSELVIGPLMVYCYFQISVGFGN